MQVYLSNIEVMALIDSASEWCSIMSDGDEESAVIVDERLDNGLGSALYKLYKGRIGQRNYVEYAKRRKEMYPQNVKI